MHLPFWEEKCFYAKHSIVKKSYWKVEQCCQNESYYVKMHNILVPWWAGLLREGFHNRTLVTFPINDCKFSHFLLDNALDTWSSYSLVDNPIMCDVIFYILAIEVVIPTLESLMMTASITLPNVTMSVFGSMTPTFQMPSVVILNQIEKEGIVCFYCTCIIYYDKQCMCKYWWLTDGKITDVNIYMSKSYATIFLCTWTPDRDL